MNLFLVFVSPIKTVYAQSSSSPEKSIGEYLCTPTDTNLYDCINKIYRFSIVVGFVIAVMFIVFAGYLYMTGGEKGITQAKSIVSSTGIALVIMITSFILLKQINPNLVVFKSIQPPEINDANIEGPVKINVDTVPTGTGTGTGTGTTPGPRDPSTPPTGMVLAKSIAPDIIEDMRYATSNNFMHEVLYSDPSCYLTSATATLLKKASDALNAKKPGYKLKTWDCYRPLAVQQKMFDKFPDPRYVARPDPNAKHPQGKAVDVTIIDSSGSELEMPTEFDAFSPSAGANSSANATATANRALLQQVMTSSGFGIYSGEWWHFNGQ